MKLTVAALFLALFTAAPAAADQGRALLPTGYRVPVAQPDAAGAQRAVALPDGGAALFAWEGPNRGIAGVRMRADGTRDASFRARIRTGRHTLVLRGALRRPDGRLLVTATRLASAPTGLDELVLAQLTSSGALDPSFGLVHTGIAGYSGAALAPDGSAVVTGTDAAKRWVVARIGPVGEVEQVAQVPGSVTGDYSTGARVAADGRITVLGGRGRDALVARLLPDLEADLTWGGGAPVRAGVHAVDLALGPDGAVTMLGRTRVARLRPDGTSDAAYGEVGVGDASFGRLLAEPDGGVLVYRSPYPQPRAAGLPALVIDRLSPAGARTTVTPRPRFGGGASLLASRRTKPLRQNGFAVGELVRRPDGSYLAAGGVSLIQYTGEGEGFSSAQDAVVALTPQLTVDRGFGPAFAEPRIGVRPLGRNRHGRLVRVRVRTSGPGLLSLRIRDLRGRVIAAGLAPVHKAGSSTVLIRATRRHGRPVEYTATFRDLAGAIAGVAASP